MFHPLWLAPLRYAVPSGDVFPEFCNVSQIRHWITLHPISFSVNNFRNG